MIDITQLRAVAADVRYRMDAQSADVIAYAADEIARLQKDYLEAANCSVDLLNYNTRLNAEIDRLEAGRKALLKTNQWQAREIERLLAALESANAALQYAEYPKVQEALGIIRKALAKEGK